MLTDLTQRLQQLRFVCGYLGWFSNASVNRHKQIDSRCLPDRHRDTAVSIQSTTFTNSLHCVFICDIIILGSGVAVVSIMVFV